MIRFGLIGAGPNGTGNIKHICKHVERARLAAIADLNREAAQQVKQEHGDAHTVIVADYRDFLDQVDAVVISSPNFLHVEQAIACAEAGKHVWIEKPMALTTADADRICAAVDRAGVASFIGFSVRFGAIPRTMKTVFEAGRIGELRSIWSRRCCTLGKGAPLTGWRAEYAKSGGVMSELIAHEIDWMVDIAGMPTSVHCRKHSLRTDDPRDNDHIWITFGFAAGATGTIEGSQAADIADYYKGIIGSRGSVHDRKWGGEVHLKSAEEGDIQLDAVPPIDKHEHFLDVIEGGAVSLADVHWGRAIVALSDRAIESAMTGEVVHLDPARLLARR
jgi:predicted dehydrogenase